jgi:hypothetical protein
VNNINAVVIGGLANKQQFFGDSVAEVISSFNNQFGGWNDDIAQSVESAYTWSTRSSPLNYSVRNGGVFSSVRATGDSVGAYGVASHRTILSGY